MYSLCSRARATVLTALIGLSLSPAAQAADMPFAPPPPPVDEPVEWATGWYLRGDLGYSEMTTPSVSSDFIGNLARNGSISGGLGVGYQYNNWIRTDITLDRSVFRPSNNLASVWCPYGAVPLSNGGVPVGVLADPSETCTPIQTAHLNRTSLMVNAYVDLGNWYGFTPYVGAGLGGTYLQQTATLNYFRNSDGMPWAPDLTLPSGSVPQWIYVDGTPFPIQIPFGPTNWNRAQQKKSVKFAWNLMAGVSYDITENLKVDVGYRFLNAGAYTTLPSLWSGKGPQERDILSHEVRVGLRLMAN